MSSTSFETLTMAPRNQNPKKKSSASALSSTRFTTIKKKASELSTLCNAQVCVLCFSPDGRIASWPENDSDVLSTLQVYRQTLASGGSTARAKKTKGDSDSISSGSDHHPKLGLLSSLDDSRNPCGSSSSLRSLLNSLDSMLDRIRVLEEEKIRVLEEEEEKIHLQQPLQLECVGIGRGKEETIFQSHQSETGTLFCSDANCASQGSATATAESYDWLDALEGMDFTDLDFESDDWMDLTDLDFDIGDWATEFMDRGAETEANLGTSMLLLRK